MGSSGRVFSLTELLSQANAKPVVNKAIHMTFLRATHNSWKTVQPKKTKDSTHFYLDEPVDSVSVTYRNMGNLRASTLRKEKSFSPASAPVYIS